MKIDGRAIADTILTGLATDVASLSKKGVIPTLAVILVGDDPASLSFIRQKRIAAEKIGAKLMLDQLPSSASSKSLTSLIEKYNQDPNVHGIIIQRPLPKESRIDRGMLLTVAPAKDIDGFVPNSPFNAPVAEAVATILEEIHQTSKHIVIIGRGETAGAPIAKLLIKQGVSPVIVHSQTPDPVQRTKTADIIISCVGKPRVITAQSIKPGAVVIGVGMHREDDGKLHGDYEEHDIADIASYFTPTPGGVGPVNVACLMKNLIVAAKKSIDTKK